MDFAVTGPEGKRSLIAEGAISEKVEGEVVCTGKQNAISQGEKMPDEAAQERKYALQTRIEYGNQSP